MRMISVPERRFSFGIDVQVLLRLYLPSGTTNLGESKLDTPDLTLVAQTVLSNELQLRITIWAWSVFEITYDLSRDKLVLSGR
jgi:hypothetical protein